MVTKSIDHLFDLGKRPRTPRARCVVCGAPRALRIQATIARMNSLGKPVQGQARTVSVTVCDEHAGKVWDRVAGALAG